MERLIFHIDVNSAYLSWTAVEQLKNGAKVDLREIPSIIGGDIKSRHGVVLAKSIPAKAYGIRTGEPVSHALTKCPNLVSAPPDHKLYSRYSRRLMELLTTFCPDIEQVNGKTPFDALRLGDKTAERVIPSSFARPLDMTRLPRSFAAMISRIICISVLLKGMAR